MSLRQVLLAGGHSADGPLLCVTLEPSPHFHSQEDMVAQVSTNGDLTIWSINSLAALFSTKIVEKDASVDQSKVRSISG